MLLLRFILPFLFVRNWYSGAYELSRSRCILFGLFVALCVGALYALVLMHEPVVYQGT
jgi:hypothetical protein